MRARQDAHDGTDEGAYADARGSARLDAHDSARQDARGSAYQDAHPDDDQGAYADAHDSARQDAHDGADEGAYADVHDGTDEGAYADAHDGADEGACQDARAGGRSGGRGGWALNPVLIVPWDPGLGAPSGPAELPGSWLLDQTGTMDLLAAAGDNPATRWCLTITGPRDGTAAAHGCAPAARVGSSRARLVLCPPPGEPDRDRFSEYQIGSRPRGFRRHPDRPGPDC